MENNYAKIQKQNNSDRNKLTELSQTEQIKQQRIEIFLS